MSALARGLADRLEVARTDARKAEHENAARERDNDSRNRAARLRREALAVEIESVTEATPADDVARLLERIESGFWRTELHRLAEKSGVPLELMTAEFQTMMKARLAA